MEADCLGERANGEIQSVQVMSHPITVTKRDIVLGSTGIRKPQRPKKYICPVKGCGKAYNRPCLLEQHSRTHSNVKPFVCSLCNAGFGRKDHLQRHMLKHTAQQDKPYHCEVCGKGLNSPQHLERHLKTHYKSFQCSHCGDRFYKYQTMRAHVRAEHEPKRGDCPHCHKHFDRPGRLADHIERIHGVEKVVCNICLKSFHIDELAAHMEQHEQDENPENKSGIDELFTFPVAKTTKKRSTNAGESTLELLVNNVDRRLKCEYTNCHRLFRRAYDYERHLAWHKRQDEALDRRLAELGKSSELEKPGELLDNQQQQHI